MDAAAMRSSLVHRPLVDADDAALVLGLQREEAGAAALVWRRFVPMVRAAVRRMLGPGRDEDDVVQEVFLRFFGSVHRLREPALVRAFLFGICVRTVRKEIRRRKLRSWLRLAGDSVDDLAVDWPAVAGDPEARDAIRRFYAVLDNLRGTEDGCNSCSCTAGGTVVCTEKACAPDGGGAVCQYGGKRYEDGAHFPASDGCNECKCERDGTVSCTGGTCPHDGGPAVCTYGGKRYEAGASFPSEDGCNTCTCGANGSVGCTKRACLSDAGAGCFYNGKRYEVGARFGSIDGCNECGCSAGGVVACTERACPVPDGGIGCFYDGKRWDDGATFPSEDGCNTCGCHRGEVACTLRACAPDAGSDAH